VFRTFTADLTLETKWDWTKFLLFGVVINNSAGTVWDALTLNYGNVIKTGEVAGIFSGWFIGSILVIIRIYISQVAFLHQRSRNQNFLKKNYWEYVFYPANFLFFKTS